MSAPEHAAAELSRLADEQGALRRVATLVASEATPERVLECVTEEAAKLLGVGSSAVFRYESARAVRCMGRWDGDGLGGFPVGAVVPLVGELALSRVWRTGQPARTDGYEGIPGRVAEEIRALGIHSIVAAPITMGGALWGAIVVAAERGPLPARAERRLGDFCELVALALASAAALVAGARRELGLALEELRELARGIHPAILSERGLVHALEALADRAPLPVELRLDQPSRLPEPIEAAAYFVASEALTNVAKHARARSATIRWAHLCDGAVLEIGDDGVGGASLAAGSGLQSLRDRVEALGGRLEFESPPGGGALVRARLPLRCPAPDPPSGLAPAVPGDGSPPRVVG